MPNGVKFSASPMSGTIAMESPNDSAVRSMPSMPRSCRPPSGSDPSSAVGGSPASGNSAATKA